MTETSSAQDPRSQTPPPPTGRPYAAMPQTPNAAPAGATPSAAGFSATVHPGSKPRKRMPVWAIVALSVIAALVVFTVGSCALGGGDPTAKTVGVIDIDGSIGSDPGANTPEGLLAQLDSAANDPQVAAVVLRVNSGGGAAAAGEEMARYVADFSKPIVVSTASSNASAAYLISSQTDYIFANEASSVGAIGTIIQLTDYSKLLDLLGIQVNTIASAESKDSSYGTRPLTDEEIAYYKAQVDQINATFVESVAAGRDMSIEDVQKLATGMAFTGEDALENGLIDEIGTYRDACNKAASLAGLGSYRVKNMGSDDTDLAALLAALLFSESKTTNESTTTILEGAPVNGQLS